MPHTRSFFLAMVVFAVVGCGEREPGSRPADPRPIDPAPTIPSAAQMTGWPTGLGRALVLRLVGGDESFRLVVPELGDRRLADSALSLKPGDSMRVALLGRPGKLGDGSLRVLDEEAGSGSCVTWPLAEVTGIALTGRGSGREWRLGAESDSVAAVGIESLAGMRGADSTSLATAVSALLATVPATSDSLLHGFPFAIRSAYSFRLAGVSTIIAELVRASSSEADPREERLLIVGEQNRAGEQKHHLVYSRRVSGKADSTPVTDMLTALLSRHSGRGILVLSVEDESGMRLQLLERVGSRRWKLSWASVVSFC